MPQQVQAALQEQERDWQDRLDSLRTRLRNARERVQAAEQSASQHHLHQCGVNSTVFGKHPRDQPPEPHRA